MINMIQLKEVLKLLIALFLKKIDNQYLLQDLHFFLLGLILSHLSKQYVEFCWSFLVCVLSLISLWEKVFVNVKSAVFKISQYLFTFLKKIGHNLKDFICTSKMEEIFSQTWKLFYKRKTLNLGVNFCTKN